jgi:hypothetical protein
VPDPPNLVVNVRPSFFLNHHPPGVPALIRQIVPLQPRLIRQPQRPTLFFLYTYTRPKPRSVKQSSLFLIFIMPGGVRSQSSMGREYKLQLK